MKKFNERFISKCRAHYRKTGNIGYWMRYDFYGNPIHYRRLKGS